MDKKDPYNTQTDRQSRPCCLSGAFSPPPDSVCVCVLLILLSSACVQDLKGPGRQVLGADFYFFLLSSFHLTSLVECLSWINAPYTHTRHTSLSSYFFSIFFHFLAKKLRGSRMTLWISKSVEQEIQGKEIESEEMGSSRESLGEGEESFVGGSLTDPRRSIYTRAMGFRHVCVCLSCRRVHSKKREEEEEEKTLSFLERDGSSDRSLLHTALEKKKSPLNPYRTRAAG